MVDDARDRYESSDFNTGAAGEFNLPSTPAVLLPVGWEPGNWDVICQRGKDCQYHGEPHLHTFRSLFRELRLTRSPQYICQNAVGNRRFRICIENHLDSYINSKTRQEKSAVISSIVSSIKSGNNHAGGFIAMVSTAEVARLSHVSRSIRSHTYDLLLNV
jgi:hypothetical protein